MAVTTGRKPSVGVKRTPAQVVKMVELRAARLAADQPVERRIATAEELVNIANDYRDQLKSSNGS